MFWKVKIENESCSIDLSVGLGSRVVIVFVVGIELEVSAERQQAACIEACVAPFGVLAGVEELGTDVGSGMIGVNCEATFSSQSIAVAPIESAVGPIHIGAVLVCS